MHLRRAIALASVVAFAACRPDLDSKPAPAKVAELRRADEAPLWAVGYGAEFWRKRAEATQAVVSAAIKAGPEFDLSETIERVNHAFARGPLGDLRSESSTFEVVVDGNAVWFSPARSDVEARVALRSIERGDADWQTSDGGDAFVLGNTLQRRLELGGTTIVEHVESRVEGVELTWVLPERPEGEGPLHIALAVDGLTPVGRSESGHHFADASGIARVRVSDAVLRDVAGGEWHLAMQADADGLRLDVPAEILAGARYPLAIDPVVSAEFGMDTPVPGTVAGGTWRHRIACTTGTCLVVWNDNRTGTGSIRATRFDVANGTVLDPGGLEISPYGNAADIAVVGGEFLVVYSSGNILGRRVAVDGTMPAAAFVIGWGYNPTIATNGSTSVVAYAQYVDQTRFYDIFVATLSGTAVTSTNVLVSGTNNWEYEPQVAWDGQGFVLAWYTSNGTDYDVWLARLGLDGAVTAAPAILAGGAGYQYAPSVCGAGGGGGSLVTWYDTASNSNRAQRYSEAFAVVGSQIVLGAMGSATSCAADASNYLVVSGSRRNRIVKATGALLTAAPGLANPMTWDSPDVALHGSQFIVVATQYNVNRWEGAVSRIAADATLVDSPGIALQTVAAGQVMPVIAFDGTNHLVAWTDYVASGQRLRAVIVDNTGAAVDPAGITLAAGAQYETTVAYGGGRYLVGWTEAGSVKAVRVLPNGTVEDGTPKVVASGYAPRFAFDGTRFVAVWYDYSGSHNIRAATVLPATGAVAAPFSVAATAAEEYLPSVACTTTGRCLVVWYTGEGDIYTARIDGGALLDSTPRPIAVEETASFNTPRVATDNASFLTVYTGWSWQARRVAADGTLPDVSATNLSTHPGWVSFDGTNYVVTGSGGSTSLRVAQVTPAGVLLNPNGISIATSAYPFLEAVASRATGTRRSLVVYSTYDDTTGIKNRRIKGRFVAFTSAPVANSQSVSTSEDTARAITLASSDSDGDPTTYSIVSGPSHGTLSGTAPNLTYTPDANYNGSDSFTFKVNDGSQDSNTATVSITINAVNDAPVASSSSVTTSEDTAVSVPLSATDVENSSLTYSIVSWPAHGTLSGTAPNYTYTPAANYNGTDSFTWRARDGSLFSNTATVTITIDPVNDAPVANNQSVTTAEDNAVGITLTGSDIDGNTVTYTVLTQPSYGTLTGTAPNLTYTPAVNYNGGDSFTFKVNDGTVDSTTATVSISVTAVNDAPVASSGSASTSEDTAVAVTLVASDIDGNSLTYSIVSAPAHGVLTGTAPNLTYTPVANYSGSDSFTFRASDGTANSNIATVSITISSVNDAPVAAAQSVTTDEDAGVAIALGGSDVDGDSISFVVVTQPSNGTLTGTAPNLTYTPAANYHGSDSFTFKVNDGSVDSSSATVSITVTPVNDAPVASHGNATTAEDTPASITLSASDVDGNALTYSIASGPSQGTLTGTAPNLTYTPAANYTGGDSFTFRTNDGSLDSNTATVSITITSVNDAPVAAAQSVTTDEDAAIAVTLAGSDVDGDTLTYAVVTQPVHGTLTGTAPNLTYTPAANYNGADSFTFEVNDGTVDSSPATVAITVTPVNDAPVASAQTVTTAEDVGVAIALAGTDIDGDSLGFVIVAGPAHGVLSGTAPALTYMPATNYNGSDSFTFKVNDGSLDSATATVSITVIATNDVPVAATQSVTTAEDTAVAITVSGSDVDGDSLGYVVVTQPAHGTLSGSAPNLTYTPGADYHGADAFTFRANDGNADSASATVNITVTPVNDAPVAIAQTVTVDQGEQATITLSATDVDGDTLSFVVTTDPDEGTLSGTPPNLTYDAPTAFRGTTTFTFTASDGALSSAAATVTINVNNGAPTVTAAADLLAPVEGQDVEFTSTAADPGGDALTYAWDFGDGESSTDPNPTHAYADEGTYTATVTVSDGLATATATVEIEVQNGAPILVPSSEAVSGDEATALVFTANVSDPGTGDTLTVAWDWGDGSVATTGTTATHAFADNGTYTVTVTVVDNDGASVVGTRAVTIGNVPPVPEAHAPLTVDAGTEVTTQLAATDRAGAADPLTWVLIDGPGALTPDGAYSWTPSRRDAGGHVVTARVSDDDGGTNDLVFAIEVVAIDDGCGCRTSRSAGGNALVLLGALAVVLRRRRDRRSV